MQWVNSRSASRCRVSRIRGSIKGGGRYIADMVFPGTAFGYVLRSPHAHARIRSIDTAKAKAAPGVLAVLTGADYKAAGFGDLPVPGGLKRRDGVARLPAALSGSGRRPRADDRRLCRLRRRRDLLPGDRCLRTDRGGIRGAAGHRLDRRCRQSRRAAGLGRLPEQYRLRPDRGQQGRRPTPPSPSAAHVVKHHFVINRVTAAAMEPRGCIGMFEPIEGRYTIYTTLAAHQRVPDRTVAIRPEGSRQQDPRRLRRHRRQLRHEVGGL